MLPTPAGNDTDTVEDNKDKENKAEESGKRPRKGRGKGKNEVNTPSNPTDVPAPTLPKVKTPEQEAKQVSRFYDGLVLIHDFKKKELRL